MEKKQRVKKELPTCIICAEKLNKTTHANIKCLYCPFEACQICCRTYILNESIVKCMNPECGREWTRKFIRDTFPLSFITGQLRDHRENLLFQREQALLPATQPIIEARNECKRLDKIILEKERVIRDIRREIQTIYEEKQRITLNPAKKERVAFVRACPDEDCRGFLSSAWKCGVCEKWTCPDCHVVKGYTRDEAHECNPDNVATAQLLARDTKPCPKCGEGIFKIDGCDQMWCTNCHTAFSWRTGTIENRIHNPHYYEWMRRTNNGAIPREAGDNPCAQNRELNHYTYETISVIMGRKHRNATNFRAVLSRVDRLIRNTVHLTMVERPPRPEAYQRRNELLRVQYLSNEISEADFKLLLQRDDKRHHKSQEVSEIFDIVVNVVTDIMFRFARYIEDMPVTTEIDTEMFVEIDRIVDYANECLADVSKTYGTTRMALDYTIRLHTGNYAINKLAEMYPVVEEAPFTNNVNL